MSNGQMGGGEGGNWGREGWGGGGTDGRQGEADLSANDKMTPAITEFTAQLYPYEKLSRKGGNDAIYTQTELSTFYLFNICGMSKKNNNNKLKE